MGEAVPLAVMAGGDAADIERVRPYVLAMARRLTHMGPTGAGQTTKLCNQVIVGCTMAVLAEATRLAVNAGIDAERLPEALAGGFADSIPLQLFVPRMVQGIRRVSAMRGDGVKAPRPDELDTARVARRSVVAQTDITANVALTPAMLGCRRPGTGIAPRVLPDLVGRCLVADVVAGTVLQWHHFAPLSLPIAWDNPQP